MSYLIQKIEDMIAEEQGSSSEYIELAEELFEEGLPKEDAVKIMNIARDEQRHFQILKSILKKL